ncbi:sulfur-rich protein [Chlamydia trachomatis]|jgi:Chlamydia 15 kDa cysteine-rich outer membrane protein (CRPA).|uniref:Sulfur-rich protein n=2 Tax=Chlamydia muridarum TaxID=83560 RepID=SRP_CHLMU|nr:sulfur-rich protein [Chlamydia muridarum]Q9PJV1.1 RecName: Full=Sulfur-rich protein; AltName: Full=Cysteine-rich protein A [Chlamydia muridarum str. Nigg]UFT35876.1 sulfur-rich protein [Chlamydia trachomatis]AAF39536.1 Srp [Chlamydia muridarum str. Nigg]AHH23111.1 hypothetical protein TAC_03815 [Chlamydia muridarum str. Nigg3 CMUT3-5]AHH24036.1 hypothetical protein Y015_03815 [Chlamydia muridarum str. Nigg CM972]AID38241.1 hypothetical protein BB17_03865 [Chlamydia muridarum str. Nigg 2 MC
MSTTPIVSGVTSQNNSSENVSNNARSLTLKERASKILSSTAFKVGLAVVGIFLVILSIVLLFILPATAASNPIYLAIPAILGCVNICIGILSMNKGSCSEAKWKLCKNVLKTSEDILDDGELNNSNKIFTDDNLSRVEDIVITLSSRRNSVA